MAVSFVILVGQPLLAVHFSCSDAEQDSQEWLSYEKAGCPILAGFARVGIFGPPIPTFPVIFDFKPPPFEMRKGWGTRCIL
jgi:hypothetical protein